MRVIAFTDALNAVGPRQVVALSRGSADGVENGQTFSIYQPGERVVDRTDYTEGSVRKFFHPHDAKVTLPPEFIGHVMIFRTFERVSYGLVMDGVKPVHLGDFLYDPDYDALKGPGGNGESEKRFLVWRTRRRPDPDSRFPIPDPGFFLHGAMATSRRVRSASRLDSVRWISNRTATRSKRG